MKDEYDFSNGIRGKFFNLEGRAAPTFHTTSRKMWTSDELTEYWARLDELGASDFLPEGAPDDPPAKPDLRKFFDD